MASLPADPRLLAALDHLLRECSVSRAAARLGLRQPAMSHALKRLRAHYGDPLLVRGGHGLVRTAKGEALVGPVREAVLAIERAFAAGEPFVAATTTRRWTIATTDGVAALLLPALLAHLRRTAPASSLQLVSITGRPIVEPLATGELDLAVTYFKRLPESLRHQRLFSERYAALVRADHPRAGRRLRLADLRERPHVLVAPRGASASNVERALAEAGVVRRIAVELPHFLLAPRAVAALDGIAILSERLARAFAADDTGVAVSPLGVELPPYPISQIWHERMHDDSAHRWLRRAVREALLARAR